MVKETLALLLAVELTLSGTTPTVQKTLYDTYKDKPALSYNLIHMSERYNLEMDELFYLNKLHRVFMIEPSVSLDDIGRFESDMEKLGALYYLGVKDCTACLEDLKGYLNYL